MATRDGEEQKSTVPLGSATEQEPDVFPTSVNVLMATLWILLFGGRWLGVPLLQIAGLLTPQTVAFMDDGPLQKIYLIMLSITLLVLALRTVRQAQSQKTVP